MSRLHGSGRLVMDLPITLSPQGFSTTKTTELKSVGDAVQIVALFIAGTITLNVPNCEPPCLRPVWLSVPGADPDAYSPTPDSNRGEPSLHYRCRSHGISPQIQHLGPTGLLLACQLAVCRIHSLSNNDILQHGWLHPSRGSKRVDIVCKEIGSAAEQYELTSASSTAHCWGNFAGPFVVKESEAPTYTGATIGLLVGYAIKAACHILLLGKSPI